MESAPRPLDPDPRPLPAAKVSTFPNGTLKKHHHRPVAPPPAAELYRECLKNHAASLGGHAIDGCGEFMPSPAANPLDPTSLKCAACGCHRNFHRRIHQDLMMDEEEMEDSDEEDRRRRESSSSPPAYLSSSAPHMLLALSSGLAGPGPGLGPGTDQVRPGVLPRKRFRTKFSPDQKEKMQELSERLRWRMQKRDEAVVEEFCKEIGVGKGVFKVWMHNNKHNFVPGSSSRRGEIGSSSSGGGGGGGIDGNNSGGGGGNSHVVNGPPCC